ncbi:GerMN domain-containing protein [Bacillus sp. REN16]|uniref:GerMN domain-containing protein n=1 Tax=Bacillus sp. REN16 TaxID=2887296 RepID=UPI001E45D63C|nr:GerMN domain-containing protein [Bacillus sp. REN16]MCC3356511.1 GerMN domain-containing protein [Bacillus sp. REN16]
MRKITKSAIAATVVTSTVLLSGCGLFGGKEEAKQMDPPKNEAVDETVAKGETPATEATDQEEAATETVKRDLYLIDENGLVVPYTVDLPKQDAAARQVLEYLVAGGPLSEILPDGFRAVIPQDTVVDVNLKDGTITADFSKEFANYNPEDEAKILQAITYTLTQFENVNNVVISVNGYQLEEMPVDGTPIPADLSRADGINIDNSGVVDITNSRPVTLYFYVQNDEGEYYVPVTKRVENTGDDRVSAVVNALINGPDMGSDLISDIHQDVKLLGTKMEDGKVTLDFNEAIFGAFNEKMISKHVINSLVLSLTEQPEVKGVAITVNGSDDVVTEDGKSLTEPVTRPSNVNTGSF